MKLYLEKEFVKVVENVASAVGGGTLKVLIHTKKRDSATVILTSNNGSLEMTSYQKVDADIGDELIENVFERKIYIDYWQFSRLLKIAFSMEEKVVFSIQGENDFSLVIKDNIFPVKAIIEPLLTFPVVNREKLISLKVSRLKEMAGLIRNVISEKEITDKVMLRIENNKFSMSSSDGCTASISYMDLEEKTEDAEAVVAGKDISTIINKLSGSNIGFAIGEKEVVFVSANIKCTIRKSACIPLRVEKLFSLTSEAVTCTFNRQMFLNYLRLLDIYKDNKLVVGLSNKDGEVVLETESNKIIASAIAEISGDTKEIEVYFNGQYLIEIFSKLNTEKISINISGELSPFTTEINNNKILFLPINMKARKASKHTKK